MRDVLILTEADLRACVAINQDAVAVAEDAFRALSGGHVVMPPIMSIEIPGLHAEMDMKTAYIPGYDGFALKVASSFQGNAALGLPTLGGLMLLFSAETGLLRAMLLDNGYLTAVRTAAAAAGAVAAKYLAPEQIETVGVLGTGEQARLQVEAARLVRPFSRVLIWGRDTAKAETCAADLAADGFQAGAADAETVVRESQLLITATAARAPIVKRDWLHPGLHITAMGSDFDAKQELDPGILADADLYVADRVAQCAVRGELRGAREVGLMAEDPRELGDLIAGGVPGRRGAGDITVADLTGTGAQDTTIATLALKTAMAAGLGTVFRA
jgi:ectoine utilization protein EutC